MQNNFVRLEALIGGEAVTVLKNATVAIVGLGGVGSFAAEAIVRCGVGTLLLCDGDRVDPSNINRQLPADEHTIGEFKADVLKARYSAINSSAQIAAYCQFWSADNDCLDIGNHRIDYVIDAIDRLSAKAALIKKCFDHNVKIISSMGAGNRLDPTAFRADDIYRTYNDPLAKKLRKMLREQNVSRLKVVYSPETRQRINPDVLGSAVFATGACGLLIAREVIMELSNIQ